MPELPEVETVARGLRESVIGARIQHVDLCWSGCVETETDPPQGLPQDPRDFCRRLRGAAIEEVGRRGKWLVVRLEGNDALLVHLRMSGQLLVDAANSAEDAHTRALLTLRLPRGRPSHRLFLRFRDMRKFGRLVLTDRPQRILAHLGPEPLSRGFTAARFQTLLSTRRGRIKNLLLDQRLLAGLGNIYANEALWRASVHPLKRGNELSTREIKSLHRCLRQALRDGIEAGGTTLSRNGLFRGSDGRAGGFSARLAVYGRDGESCPRCRAPIERLVVAQRSTFLCPRCQTPPR